MVSMILDILNHKKQSLISRETLDSACYLRLRSPEVLEHFDVSENGDVVQFALMGYKGVSEYSKVALSECIARSPIKGIHFSNNVYKLIGLALLDRPSLNTYLEQLYTCGLLKEKYLLKLFFPDLHKRFGRIEIQPDSEGIITKCLEFLENNVAKPLLNIDDLSLINDVADLVVVEDFLNKSLVMSQGGLSEATQNINNSSSSIVVSYESQVSNAFGIKLPIEIKQGQYSMSERKPKEFQQSVSWLHITDLHCGMDGSEWLWPNVEEAFFKDLEKLHRKCGPWDLVLFTGDLTQKGLSDEFAAFDKVISRIWDKLRSLGSDPILVPIPGNHDLVRPNVLDAYAAHIFEEWNNPVKKTRIRQAFWNKKPPEYFAVIENAFKNYMDWFNRSTSRISNLTHGLIPGDFSASLDINGVKLGLIGLNSTYIQLSGGNFEKSLTLDPRQLHAITGTSPVDWINQHHFCFLMTHQPPSWLSEEGLRALNSEINPAGRFALHFFGHMHEHFNETSKIAGGNPKTYVQGSSLFGLEYFGEDDSRNKRSHGYSAGKIFFTKDGWKLRQWPRTLVPHKDQSWHIVPDTGYTYDDELDDQGTPAEILHSVNKNLLSALIMSLKTHDSLNSSGQSSQQFSELIAILSESKNTGLFLNILESKDEALILEELELLYGKYLSVLLKEPANHQLRKSIPLYFKKALEIISLSENRMDQKFFGAKSFQEMLSNVDFHELIDGFSNRLKVINASLKDQVETSLIDAWNNTGGDFNKENLLVAPTESLWKYLSEVTQVHLMMIFLDFLKDAYHRPGFPQYDLADRILANPENESVGSTALEQILITELSRSLGDEDVYDKSHLATVKRHTEKTYDKISQNLGSFDDVLAKVLESFKPETP